MLKRLFRTRYRVVADDYLGFEAQRRLWFWPFYSQWIINTHSSVEEAKRFVRACTFSVSVKETK